MGHHQAIIQELECKQKLNGISWRSSPLILKMYVKCTRINSVAKMPKDILKNIKYIWFLKIINNYKWILLIRNNVFVVYQLWYFFKNVLKVRVEIICVLHATVISW